MALAGLETARPDETETVPAGVVYFFQLSLGQPGSEPAGVGFHQGFEPGLLGGTHVRITESGGLQRFRLLVRPGDDVVRGSVGNNGAEALRIVQGQHQRPAKVLLGGKGPATLLRSGQADFGRICAHEIGRHGDFLTVHDGEVDRQMVPFKAPAPGAGGTRLAEDREEIPGFIAAGRVLDGAQNVLQGDDRVGLDHAALAQPGGEEVLGQLALSIVHFRQRQTFAGFWDIVPVGAFFIAEIKHCFLPQIRRERIKPRLGRRGHFLSRFRRRMAEASERKQRNCRDQDQTGVARHSDLLFRNGRLARAWREEMLVQIQEVISRYCQWVNVPNGSNDPEN